MNHPLEYSNANFYLQIITGSLQARYNAIKPPPRNKQKTIAQSLQPRTGKRLLSFHSQRSFPGLLTDIFHHIKQPVSTPRLLYFIHSNAKQLTISLLQMNSLQAVAPWANNLSKKSNQLSLKCILEFKGKGCIKLFILLTEKATQLKEKSRQMGCTWQLYV